MKGCGSGSSGGRAPRFVAACRQQVADVRVAGIAPRHRFVEVGREADRAPAASEQTPGQGHAVGEKCPVVEVPTAVAAARLEVRGKAGQRARKVVDRLLEERRLDEPRDDVASFDTAWRPRGLATREGHVAAAPMQLIGDLASGLAAPDDEDAAGGERIRARIALGVDDENVGRKVRDRRAVRPLERAGREHDCIGAHLALGGVEDEPATRVRAEGA